LIFSGYEGVRDNSERIFNTRFYKGIQPKFIAASFAIAYALIVQYFYKNKISNRLG